MTQEDKELLLKDLCARLPYGVKCEITTTFEFSNKRLAPKVKELDYLILGAASAIAKGYEDNTSIKSYLFPLSSMTDEQCEELKQEYCNIACDNIKKMFANPDESHLYSSKSSSFEIDWLNKHHIDYRGLIEKGLAIDATGLEVYKRSKLWKK